MNLRKPVQAVIAVCAASLMLFLAALVPAYAQNKSDITIDDVLERRHVVVRSVDWVDSTTLYAQIRSSSGETTFQTIYSNGRKEPGLSSIAVDTPSAKAILGGSLSPSNDRLVSRVDGEWRVQEFSTLIENSLDLPALPEGVPTAYGWHKIDWAEDGSRVAISEMYDGRQEMLATPEEVEINGVKIQETSPDSDHQIIRATRIIVTDGTGRDAISVSVFPGCYSAGHSFSNRYELFVALTCFETGTPHTRILRMEPDTGVYEEIYRVNSILQESHPKVSPDGKMLAFPLPADGSGWATFLDLGIIDAQTGQVVHRLLPSSDQGITTATDYYWSKDSLSVYVRARSAGLDEVWALSLSGNHQRLMAGDRRRYGMALSPSRDKLSYLTIDGYGYRDVRVFDIAAGQEEIYYVIDDPKEQFNFGRWQQIEWESDDSIRPKGWLITPPNFDPMQKYPLYVDVHGNGTGSDLYLFAPLTLSVANGPLEWHAFAALGYVVFVPDYRMTGNYGPEPIIKARETRIDAIVFDAKDVVTGVNHVVSLGFIDSNRIAMMGHSMGGPRVFKALTDAPTLFAAGVLNESSALDRRSILELASSGPMTGTDSNRYVRTWLGPDIGDDPEPYKANHVLDAVKIETPTLFLRGGYGGKISSSVYASHETAFTLIRQAGTPTRYFTFLDEGHTYSTPEAAGVAFDLVTDWLAEHMPAEPGDPDYIGAVAD